MVIRSKRMPRQFNELRVRPPCKPRYPQAMRATLLGKPRLTWRMVLFLSLRTACQAPFPSITSCHRSSCTQPRGPDRRRTCEPCNCCCREANSMKFAARPNHLSLVLSLTIAMLWLAGCGAYGGGGNGGGGGG